MDSPFPLEETEAQTLLQEALQRTAGVHWQRLTGPGFSSWDCGMIVLCMTRDP